MFLVTLLFACFNDCSYFETCDGNTLLVCGEGPDQSFGRKENPVECEGANPVCVEVGEQNATCAANSGVCDEGTADRCQGDVLVVCELFQSPLGLLGAGSDVFVSTGRDCAAEGLSCTVDESTGLGSCG
ncbi:MAG TPA: hypothetical protein PKY30_08770 [Myxococcota bacterium]|nr:hypothetical protein [Myxococcota bacterium]HNH47118.1 hypothetical protein [Myxococcota bacterium]